MSLLVGYLCVAGAVAAALDMADDSHDAGSVGMWLFFGLFWPAVIALFAGLVVFYLFKGRTTT